MNEQLFKVKIVQIAILLFSLCTIPLFGQESKVITQIDNNLYQYTLQRRWFYTPKRNIHQN